MSPGKEKERERCRRRALPVQRRAGCFANVTGSRSGSGALCLAGSRVEMVFRALRLVRMAGVAWCCFNTKPGAARAWARLCGPGQTGLGARGMSWGGLGKVESVGPLRLSAEADEGSRHLSCPRAGTSRAESGKQPDPPCP